LNIPRIDQLFEHSCETLLGYLQRIQEIGNGHAGVAVNEMYHAVMGTPEAAFRKDGIGVGNEVPIREEQQLDDVEVDGIGVFQRLGQRLRLAGFRAVLSCQFGISFLIRRPSGTI
jgi:hypothetical protein